MGITIQYLGSAAFLITTEKGTRVLIDPDIPDPKQIGKVDLILITHAAADHLGFAFDIAKASDATMVGGGEIRLLAEKNGIRREKFHHVTWGVIRQEGGISIKAVEARHMSTVNRDGILLTAIPFGYIVTTEGGSRVYHMGDTAIFTDLKLFGELYRPHILLVPVGAAVGAFAELSPSEAALATQWIGPEIAIPMHYQPGTGEAEAFATHVQGMAPHVHVVILEPGQTQKFSPYRG